MRPELAAENDAALQYQDRSQSPGEEFPSSISHGVALMGALIAALFLVLASLRRSNALDITGASIFFISMLLPVSQLHAPAMNCASRHLLIAPAL